ncbi:MAG TPA: hypothetical protein VH682_04070 [Gemmataceae bacterium]|jgi:uncharacterized membrane protein HdeD (DUF308 family)
MARDPVPAASSVASALRTFSRPWPILLAGLACTVIGLLFSQTPYTPARLIFLGIGLLLAGSAVARRLQTAGWELEDRAESAGLLALSAFVALLGFLAMEKSWDSGQIFLGTLIALALFGSFVVLLPRTGRRIVASILVLLHFGGILTAVTAVPPRQDPAPWLSMQLWTHIYRHYLTFAYLTNAYHFYSPDPGPPTLLWFHVEYADGSARWIKLPNRRESPVLLHHQRMLAAAESANNPIPGLPLDPERKVQVEKLFGRPYEILPGIPHDTGDVVVKRRRMIGERLPFKDPQDGRDAPIRLDEVEFSGLMAQYSEPQEIARRLIASFARHIGRTTPHQIDRRIAVKAVRVYRVTHNLITPREFSEGRDPVLDETTFNPFYMGKYDLDGKLLDPLDPFLFWHLPIVRLPQRYPEPGTFLYEHMPQPGPQKLVNFVEIHATQSDKIAEMQTKE